jgi:prevent-host-death family protein
VRRDAVLVALAVLAVLLILAIGPVYDWLFGIPSLRLRRTLRCCSVRGVEETGIEQARATLGEIINRALFAGAHTLITRAGKPAAVIVPVEWHEKALAAMGGNEQ